MRKIATAVILSVLLTSPAWAHKVCMLSSFEGNSVTGEAYFSTGDPVMNSPVTIQSDGREIASGKTDSEGSFTVAIPEDITSVRVTVNAGMGHVTHEDISRETAAPKPSGDGGHAVEVPVSGISIEEIRQVVASEIAPVKKMVMDIEKTYSKPDLPRILGGIGYIVGIVGAFMWGRAKRG